MPRRSGTDVLFRNGRVRRFFLPGAFCFSDAVLSVPPCAAPLFRPVPRCHPRSASVTVPVCAVSPFVPCRRSCLVLRRCSALCRVVILGLHRLPSPFVPCRRSDLRRIVIRCLRRVAVPVCGWRPAVEFRGRSDGDSAPAAGLLRPFPVLRRFRSGRPSAFL